jgi:transposase
MESVFRLYAGVDWATEAHQVCVVDATGKRLVERSFEHSAAGLAALCDVLLKLSNQEPATVAVSIETPRGAVVETLVERGFAVHSINPKQLDRLRDRHTVPGAKDDRRDAYVLADSLRHDLHLFRRLSVEDPLVIQLREAARADEDLRGEMNRLTNRLREQLLRYFPTLLSVSASADEAWLWALLELAPTPERARRLKRPKLDALLRKHRIRRVTGEQLHQLLQGPALQLAAGTVDAAAAHVKLLVPRLRLVTLQRTQVAEQLDGLLAQLSAAAPEDVPGQKCEHRDVTILQSLPGVGRIVAATMLAEASQALRDRDYAALRAHGGCAPVTRQSGKRSQVSMRQGCSGRLRHALYHWSRVASCVDPNAKRRYTLARSRGHTHGRALRGVADWLLRVAVAMLKTGTLYQTAFDSSPTT